MREKRGAGALPLAHLRPPRGPPPNALSPVLLTQAPNPMGLVRAGRLAPLLLALVLAVAAVQGR